MLLIQTLDCPYCGEPNEVEIDPSGGKKQAYEEDCQVCCRPWQVRVKIDGEGEAWVTLTAEDELADDE